MKENRRFNRYEWNGNHLYDRNFGSRGLGSTEYTGYFKCKLLHTVGGSVIVPDQIVLTTDAGENLWIQPLAFLPNIVARTSDDIYGSLFVDISLGQVLRIDLKASDYLTSYADGAQLFRCAITGPEGLASYATGRARVDTGSRLFIDLYHHTLPDWKKLILKSRLLRGSRWNIQGNRELQNVAYAYLTALDRIWNDQDLREIAMAGNELIHLRRDNVIAPEPVDPEWVRQNLGKVLELKVYREKTANRGATLKFSVDASMLASQHVMRHELWGQPMYYEVNQPFIHRIGVDCDTGVQFSANGVMSDQPNLRRFEYLVLGDATTLDGLAAPYDEENTSHIFKIETPPEGQDVLTFWMENANQDLYSGRDVELQQLGPRNDL